MIFKEELQHIADKMRRAIDDGDYGRGALIDFMEEDYGDIQAIIDKMDDTVCPSCGGKARLVHKMDCDFAAQ